MQKMKITHTSWSCTGVTPVQNKPSVTAIAIVIVIVHTESYSANYYDISCSIRYDGAR